MRQRERLREVAAAAGRDTPPVALGRRARAPVPAPSRSPAQAAGPAPAGPGRSNAAVGRQAADAASPRQGSVGGRGPAVRGTTGTTGTTGATMQAKLDVSQVGDPLEREADAVATRVVARAPVPGQAAAAAPAAVRRSTEARPSSPGLPRAAREEAATTDPGAQPEVSADLEAYITSVGGGEALPKGVRGRIEPHLGADLSGVRVQATPAAAAAAARLQARAFTYGRNIFLGDGESAADLELMAHEATHVVQQGAVDVYREDVDGAAPDVARWASVMRDDAAPAAAAADDSWYEVDIGAWVAENLASAASAIPGYTMLTQVVGRDPISDQPVRPAQGELLEGLLTYGPFGPAVAPLLTAIDVLGDVFDYVWEQLQANGLTFERLQRDIAGAWEEFGVTNGVQGNIDILNRYLDAMLADIRAFVDSIVARVIEIVREVVADVVGPLLETPEIAPIWSLAKKVFHYDPLRGETVEAPTVEILADFLNLIGQGEAVAQMTERGTLQSTADWIDTQWETFTGILGDVGQLFTDAWAAISPGNLPQLMDTLPGLVDRGAALLRRILDFGTTLVGKVLELVKASLMGWLREYALATPGYHLLTVMLERDPFTGEAVPRTAENLIRGFISLLPGGNEMYDQLAESGVIADAAGRIESAMTRLGISWELITTTFMGVWDLVTLENLLEPIATFEQIINRFGEPLGRIVEFVSVVMEVVITLILTMMNFPSDLLGNIISNAMQSIDTIMADPVQFLVNMLEAVKSGFTSFFGNIARHLVTGLTEWLFGGLRELGITAPTSLEPGAIFEFVLGVLGITEELLWQKLGEQIGAERVAAIRGAVDTLTGAWQFIRDVQERGISAIWEFISGQLSGLWDMILQKAQDWIMDTIIGQVTARLLSMLDPTGVMAVINSFMAFFDTVRSVIQYIREILEIVDRYVSTIAAVAAGNVGPGAAMLEGGLAAAIPVALGFLANLLHLGDVPGEVRKIIEGLREMVEQAITWLLEQAMRLGQAALGAIGLGGPAAAEDANPPPDPAAPAMFEQTFDVEGEAHRMYLTPDRELMIASTPMTIGIFASRVEANISKIPSTDSRRAPLVAALAAVTVDLASLTPHLQAGIAPTTAPSGDVPRLQRLAQRLRNLMVLANSGTHAGTQSDPIPLKWYKSLGAYRRLSLTRDGETLDVFPEDGTELTPPPALERLSSGGTVRIGISDEVKPRVGKKLNKVEAGGAAIGRVTNAVRDFNTLVAYWGLQVGASGLQTDHVNDMAFTGPDEFHNLWPIRADLNNAANEVYRQFVWVQEGPDVAVKTVGDLDNAWFVIESIS